MKDGKGLEVLLSADGVVLKSGPDDDEPGEEDDDDKD
jgi:hypothetical protein